MNGLQSAPEPEPAVASYAFQGDKAASQLSFAAGDPLRVKDKSSAEWWWCINSNNEEGYAPANYVAISPKVESSGADFSDDGIFGDAAEARLSVSLGGGDNPMMGNPMMGGGGRRSYAAPQGSAANALAEQMRQALGGGGGGARRPSAASSEREAAQAAAVAAAKAEEQRAAAEAALQAQMRQSQAMDQQAAADAAAAAAAQQQQAVTPVSPPVPVEPVAMQKRKKPRNGKFNILDDRSNRRFIVDINSGTFYWAEAGEAEDDDDAEVEDYDAGGSVNGAGDGNGDGSSSSSGSGGSGSGSIQPKSIHVDDGPVGIKLTNDSRGFTTVLNASGQAASKGVDVGDIILAIGGTPLPRGTDHSQIGGMIKALQRPFPMDFLPANTADPESYHAIYEQQNQQQQQQAQPQQAQPAAAQPVAAAGQPPPPLLSTQTPTQSHDANQPPPPPSPSAVPASPSPTAALPPPPAPAPQAQPVVAASYRTVQVTFGDGPMGIDLKILEADNPLVVALLGPGSQSFGSVAQHVVVIKRTIGQAQALGLQENDVIAAINAVAVPPGTGIPALKAQIGAIARPITLTLSRATKELLSKIQAAKNKEEAAARAERARQNGSSSCYGEEDGCLAAYFNSGVTSFTENPVSVSLSVREIMTNLKSFNSIAQFDTIAKNIASVNKNGGVVWSKKAIKAPMLADVNKKSHADVLKAYADIQLYMGDGPKGAGKQGNWVTLMAVLNAISKPDLVDEVFCHLIKQTTNNPNPAADTRGWEILAGCSFVTSPSQGFLLPYVLRHAYRTRLDPTPRGALALRVFQRLLPADVPKQQGSVREKAGQFTQSTLATIKTAIPPRSIYDAPLNDALRLESITEQPDNDKPLSKANEFVFLKKHVCPNGLALLSNSIRKHGGFRTEGLFRLASDAEDVAFFKDLIEGGDYRCLRGPIPADQTLNGVDVPELKDPHVAANLIKIWLRSLPEPVVPFNLYQDALDAGASNDPSAAIRLLQKLPPVHSRTLRHCVALLRELADNENATKMSHANCAMVFAPNVLRSRTNDPMLFARNQENEQRFLKHLIVNATDSWSN